jgi:protocatechuate 4,5-dioxygenase beta chain
MVERGDEFRGRLQDARPDALVVVGNDHFHQLFMDNMPAFLIGKMTDYDAIFHNETREFGMPPSVLPGDKNLAEEILDGLIEREVDMAFSDELRLDHSVVVPLQFVCPAFDIPLVPVLTNCVAPPLPPARRFVEVGRRLRAAIDSLHGDRRVAVIVSGHLSVDVGGPDHFPDHAADAAWDDAVMEALRTGDLGTAIELSSFERMARAGNATDQFLNYLLGAGVADGTLPSHAEAMKRRSNSQAWIAWEPT